MHNARVKVKAQIFFVFVKFNFEIRVIFKHWFYWEAKVVKVIYFVVEYASKMRFDCFSILENGYLIILQSFVIWNVILWRTSTMWPCFRDKVMQRHQPAPFEWSFLLWLVISQLHTSIYLAELILSSTC